MNFPQTVATARALTYLATLDAVTSADVLANLRAGHTEAVGEREAARRACRPAAYDEALGIQQAYRRAIRTFLSAQRDINARARRAGA